MRKLDWIVGAPDEEERDKVASVNAEVRAGGMGRQCVASSETKGSKTLYNVADSFMDLYVMRSNTWLIKLTILYHFSILEIIDTVH